MDDKENGRKKRRTKSIHLVSCCHITQYSVIKYHKRHLSNMVIIFLNIALFTLLISFKNTENIDQDFERRVVSN